MTITITINCDNAAFDEAGIATEAARIIREAAKHVEDGAELAALRDVNGNRVGTLEVMP